MSSNPSDNNNISSALAIIEAFGGIRPMANKMNVAVTTVQGWKQRQSIPGNRRDDILAAAQAHNIDLGSLLDASFDDLQEKGVHEEVEANTVVREKTVAPKATKSSAHEFETDEQRAYSQIRMHSAQSGQNAKTTLVIAGVLIIAAAAIGAVFAIAPKVNKLDDQQQRIAELEQQVEQMQQKVSEKQSSSLIPDDYKSQLSSLQNRVGQLAEQAQSYSSVLQGIQADLQSGNMQQRLAKVEQHLQTAVAQAKSMGLQDMMTRVQMMQTSPEGVMQLDGVMQQLASAVSLPEGAGEQDLEKVLGQLKESDPLIAETFKDVAPEDMKAAVMLIGMAQMRDSLARDHASFDQDLMILKSTLAKDDPELSAAIDRLAPKAKAGVLTPQGLSTEFRSLTGEIVAASLSGENVSIEEKAMARFGNLVTVEKDGEQISGTDTQIKVAQAQKLLDEGDVEGAIALLQQLEGPAAQKTQPFIDQAQATMMARQVQQMLGQNLLIKLKGQIQSMGRTSGMNGGYMATGGSMNSLMNEFKTLVPNGMPNGIPTGGQGQ
ncbi:MAG TPA: mitofilin family membrane protein [Alphaproteobacteria bacterium]|nr:uroporphyrinogen III synthase HEM4 [Alphaproteobacteria bacterium]HOO50283.1 mitofilin family membrane protein [Alphaproteobacteria bacterium]